MVDTFDVMPKRGVAYQTLVFPQTLGQILTDGIIFGYANNFEISDEGGINIKVKTGKALLNGCLVELTALSDSKALTDNSTNHIFLELTKNAGLRVTGAQITINTTGTAPSNSVKLAEVVTAAGDITAVEMQHAQGVRLKNAAGGEVFGNGVDGDLEVTSGTTTLTETKYYNNVWVKAGATLTANEPLIMFVKGTLRNEGTIHMNAKNTAGGVGGSSAIGVGGLGAGPAAVQGDGATGTAGVNRSAPLGNTPAGGAGGGGTGGAGGTGHSGAGGSGAPNGVGGPNPANTALNRRFYSIPQFLGASPQLQGYGASGSGGGGAGSGGAGGGIGAPNNVPGGNGGQGAGGGQGGAGGGTLIVVARNIINASGAIISSNGGNGANGTPGAAPAINGIPGGSVGPPTNRGAGGGGGASGSGGGGGGAGDGGLVCLVYSTLVNAGTITVTAGTGGTGGTAAPAHGVGGTGIFTGSPGVDGSGPLAAGVNGANGVAGVIIQHQV